MKELNKSDRKIAQLLVLAQIASDAGKGFQDEKLNSVRGAKRAVNGGYNRKDLYVREAIESILKSRNSAFRFFCCTDLHCRADSLVYFKVKVDGVYRQISFHSFDCELWKYQTKQSEKHTQRWDHGVSRETAYALIEAYNL
jgi:hypothetical protein